MRMRTFIIIVVALIFLALLVKYPLQMIGLGILLWGFYEGRTNKKVSAKSRKPMILMIAGAVVLTIGIGISANSTDKTKDLATESEENVDEESRAAEEKVKEEAKKAQRLAKEKQETAERLGLISATVTDVIDGDTIKLADGSKVRLIGINTPESTSRTEPFGKEASNYTKTKLEGKQVWLEKDVSETDQYNRLLRIVWLDIPTDTLDEDEIRDKMFNAMLVIDGYAEPYTFPPDVKYANFFRKFAQEAREKEVGLWAYGPEGTTRGDLDTALDSSQSESKGATPPSGGTPSADKGSTSPSGSSTTGSGPSGQSGASQNKSGTAQSGGNASQGGGTSGGSASQGPSGGSSSGSTKQEYYKNCSELNKVYPNGVKSDHPAYRSALDRDKDGWACEK